MSDKQCHYCKGKFHGENMVHNHRGDLVVVQPHQSTLGIRLAYRNEGTVQVAIPINYCPMCGRELTTTKNQEDNQ